MMIFTGQTSAGQTGPWYSLNGDKVLYLNIHLYMIRPSMYILSLGNKENFPLIYLFGDCLRIFYCILMWCFFPKSMQLKKNSSKAAYKIISPYQYSNCIIVVWGHILRGLPVHISWNPTDKTCFPDVFVFLHSYTLGKICTAHFLALSKNPSLSG